MSGRLRGRHLLNNGTWKWPQQKNIFNTIKTVNRHPQFLTCILLNSGVALQSGSLSRSSYSSSSSSVISMVSTFLSSSAPSFFADRLLAFFPAVRSSSSSSASFFCNYKTCWIWFTWKLPPKKLGQSSWVKWEQDVLWFEVHDSRNVRQPVLG